MNAMNEHFIINVLQLRERIPDEASDPMATHILDSRQCTFTLKPVAPNEVMELLAGLKNPSL